jgi:hypothetical protein
MYDAGTERPQVLTTTSKVTDVRTYANMLHYKTRQMTDAIEAIRRDDPDSVVVVFGDHLPMLGHDFAGYVESGKLPDSFGDFTKEQYDFSAGTPLLVIDGQKGPLDLGRIPMFRLPSVILRLLGEDKPTIFDLAQVPASVIPRPLPGVMMTYQGSAPEELCKEDTDSADCAQAADWLADTQLIDHDLFAGRQHALELLNQMPSSSSSAPPPDLHATLRSN